MAPSLLEKTYSERGKPPPPAWCALLHRFDPMRRAGAKIRVRDWLPGATDARSRRRRAFSQHSPCSLCAFAFVALVAVLFGLFSHLAASNAWSDGVMSVLDVYNTLHGATQGATTREFYPGGSESNDADGTDSLPASSTRLPTAVWSRSSALCTSGGECDKSIVATNGSTWTIRAPRTTAGAEAKRADAKAARATWAALGARYNKNHPQLPHKDELPYFEALPAGCMQWGWLSPDPNKAGTTWVPVPWNMLKRGEVPTTGYPNPATRKSGTARELHLHMDDVCWTTFRTYKTIAEGFASGDNDRLELVLQNRMLSWDFQTTRPARGGWAARLGTSAASCSAARSAASCSAARPVAAGPMPTQQQQQPAAAVAAAVVGRPRRGGPALE